MLTIVGFLLLPLFAIIATIGVILAGIIISLYLYFWLRIFEKIERLWGGTLFLDLCVLGKPTSRFGDVHEERMTERERIRPKKPRETF